MKRNITYSIVVQWLKTWLLNMEVKGCEGLKLVLVCYIGLDINPYMYYRDFAKAHSKLVFNYFFHYNVKIWTFGTQTLVAFKPL